MMHARDIIAALGERPLDRGPGLLQVETPRERFTLLADRLATEFGLPLSLLFAMDQRQEGIGFTVHALWSVDASHERILLSTALPADDPRYPSLTRTIMAAHWYERAIMDMFGIVAEGHPDPRRLIHHENVPLGTHPLRKDFAWDTVLAHADVPYPMHHVEGEGIYEIPVGPIHAGIIEPGHFRFNVAGERILTLEGKLFFTHKGVEKLCEGKTVTEALPFVERISGDMAASHALAYAQAVEAIDGVEVPDRVKAQRTAIAELERLTMHVHDIANIAGNGTGFTVMAAQGFRIKEQLMRLSDRIVGNRFWRGYIVPGGVRTDLTAAQNEDILETIRAVCGEMRALQKLAQHSDGLRERLETTGVLRPDAARAYGAVGLPARASGIDRDVRRDHPYAGYAVRAVPVVTRQAGDVYARFRARFMELDVSESLIRESLWHAPEGPVAGTLAGKDGFGISAVESWRGEIVTIVRRKGGRIDRLVVRDPSFCNWPLFGELAPGNIVPDFPLCNKSLNLSYSGCDL